MTVNWLSTSVMIKLLVRGSSTSVPVLDITALTAAKIPSEEPPDEDEAVEVADDVSDDELDDELELLEEEPLIVMALLIFEDGTEACLS